MAGEQQQSASFSHKAARTNYLPKISAAGAYLYTSKEMSLLSDEQKSTLSKLGAGLNNVPLLSSLGDRLNAIGQGLVDAFHTDTRHAGVLAVTLTQPIYMGGKIRAYDNITRYAAQIADHMYDKTLQDVIVEVDEAYWTLVALKSKKQLAEGYKLLVDRLASDVDLMFREGLARKADVLSVKVRSNEAQVALIQVDNGLRLSEMNLCRICGLPMDSSMDINVEDVPLEMAFPQEQDMVEHAVGHRDELKALELQTLIYGEKVRIARSEFLPQVALMGGYLASNPSVFNSFERQMKGMWNVGVTVSMPLITWGERKYKVRAAKADARLHRYEAEEAREKIVLQVNQCRQRLYESKQRLETSGTNLEEAEENLRYADVGLKEGVIPLSNVLEAQTAWLKARSEWVNAQVDVRLASLYLKKALGNVSH